MQNSFRYPYADDTSFETLAVRFTPDGEIRGAAKPLPTGRNAQRQVGSLVARFNKGGPEALGGKALPVDGRAQRRERDRAFARQQRKGVRKYVAQQMAQAEPPMETNSQRVKRLRLEATPMGIPAQFDEATGHPVVG